MKTEQLIEQLNKKFPYRNWRDAINKMNQGVPIPSTMKIAIERELNR